MNTDPRRFAPLGLALSVLSGLSFVGFLLTRWVASTGILSLDSEILQNGVLFSALGIVLGFALAALLNPEATRQFLTGRQAQYGSNALITLLAFVGILIFLNVIAYQNPQTWDITQDQTNTLAPETLRTLQALPAPVHAAAYYTARTSYEETRKLLENMAQNSAGNFTYEVIDPELNPVAAQQDGVERDGTIVFKMEDRREPITYPSEQEITGALLRLLNPQSRVLYFVTGHGEPGLQTYGEGSYSLLASTLQKKNYAVQALNLLSAGKVPEDATVVIAAGAQTAYDPQEIEALKTYLASGGALIIASEPPPLTNLGESPDLLASLAAEWGVELQNNLIIDPNANPASIAFSDALAYGRHPVTTNLMGYTAAFPTARSLLLTQSDAYQPVSLAQTGSYAWGEVDFDSIQQNTVEYLETEDTTGPLTLAAALEDYNTGARLVVFGDYEFASDILYERGYGDMMVNAIDWGAELESIISLTPKETEIRSFSPPGTGGLVAILLTSLCILPLIVIGAGVSAWYSRRRRG